MKQILCFVLALIMVCGSFILTASADGMKAVHCAEQSFTVSIPSDKSAEWVENYGLRISVESPACDAPLHFPHDLHHVHPEDRRYHERRF